MTNLEIITKANEVVKNVNFTKIMKVRKSTGALFLIVTCANGLDIYGCYTNNNIYASYNNQLIKLA